MMLTGEDRLGTLDRKPPKLGHDHGLSTVSRSMGGLGSS